jgi:hypothetical protein
MGHAAARFARLPARIPGQGGRAQWQNLRHLAPRHAHRGQTPIHVVGAREAAGLDRKPERTHIGAPRMSAHALVQEYLNLHDELYGLVTNGRILRLLRDSSRLIKLTYLEFDLDRIFTDGLFADFAILYRLAARPPVCRSATKPLRKA